MLQRFAYPKRSTLIAVSMLMVLSACEQPLDFDLRGGFGGGLNTSQTGGVATAPRPEPDGRGVISYPGYQVAVARRGDTIVTLSERVGLPASEVARFNGLPADTALRADELVALPRRVPDAPSGTGLDIASIAGSAIDRAGDQNATQSEPRITNQPGIEPIRHKVEPGETAFSIARLYNVSPRALADWNGLGPDLAIRDGQFLLIPIPAPSTASSAETQTAAPGQGSVTPVPPSASTALPSDNTPAVVPPASPNLGNITTAATAAAPLGMPVQGSITRAFGRNGSDGIGFDTPAGEAVSASEAGEVLAITETTDQIQVLVLRHPNGLLTVYGNIDDLTVSRGDRVRRGQKIAEVASGGAGFFYYEVRDGARAVDPVPYLQ